MADIIIKTDSDIYKMLVGMAAPFETAEALLNRIVDSYKATPDPAKPSKEKRKITLEMVKVFYASAKEVYDGRIDMDEALDQLENISGRGSAKIYLSVFASMRNGEGYKRTINMAATRYFLDQIFTDYQVDGLKNALDALNAHIEYFEGFIGEGKMKNMRRMRNVFVNKLPVVASDA